jgi:hypothetical protein
MDAGHGFKVESEKLKSQLVFWQKLANEFPNNSAYEDTVYKLEQKLVNLNSSIGVKK